MSISNLAPEEKAEILSASGPGVKNTRKVILPPKYRKDLPKLRVTHDVVSSLKWHHSVTE